MDTSKCIYLLKHFIDIVFNNDDIYMEVKEQCFLINLNNWKGRSVYVHIVNVCIGCDNQASMVNTTEMLACQYFARNLCSSIPLARHLFVPLRP